MPHPDAFTFAAYVDGSLTSEEQTRFEAHLRTCPYCQQEIETLRQTLDALPQTEVPESLYRRTRALSASHIQRSERRIRWSSRIVLSLSLLLLVLSAGWFYRSRNIHVLRGNGQTPITLLHPGRDDVLIPDRPFIWRAYPEAQLYIFRIYTPDGAQVTAFTTSRPDVILPDTLWSRLHEYDAYYWQVEVLLPDGKWLSSPLRRFTPTDGESNS